jgi:hypothetical protein
MMATGYNLEPIAAGATARLVCPPSGSAAAPPRAAATLVVRVGDDLYIRFCSAKWYRRAIRDQRGTIRATAAWSKGCGSTTPERTCNSRRGYHTKYAVMAAAK